MNGRLYELRKALKLSQKAFGEKVGLSDSAVSNMESGRYKITDTVLKLACQEFSVNEEWLRTGRGEMFVVTDNTIIAGLAGKGYDALTCKLMKTYLELPKAHREKFNNELFYFLNALRSDDERMEMAEEMPAVPPVGAEEQRAIFNNEITREEYLAYSARRYDDIKKGLHRFTTSGKEDSLEEKQA